jgi:hypothetical protein
MADPSSMLVTRSAVHTKEMSDGIAELPQNLVLLTRLLSCLPADYRDASLDPDVTK